MISLRIMLFILLLGFNMSSETKPDPITKELTIGDVILEYPEIIPKLQEYGIHCVGCHVSAYEKLGDGFASHGLSDDKIEQIISELNKVVKNHHVETQRKEPVNKSIEFTEDAAKKLRELMEKQGKKNYGVRISADPGGCSGYVYSMQFDNEEKQGDIILESSGLKVFVDQQSISVLGGTTINYVDNLSESGFKFDNPNAQRSCGCGKSFA